MAAGGQGIHEIDIEEIEHPSTIVGNRDTTD